MNDVKNYGMGGHAYINIPSKIKKIEADAFSDCTNLNSITIPEDVEKIGENAFKNCEHLNYINVDSNNKYYRTEDGVLFNYDKSELIQYPVGNNRKEYAIPENVKKICSWAFHGCGLTSVKMPSKVTTIEAEAFSDCTNLNNITIPESVEEIKWAAFANTSLESIEIPANVKILGTYAFCKCINLASVTFKFEAKSFNDLKNYSNAIFEACFQHIDVYVPQGSVDFYSTWLANNRVTVNVIE